MPPKKKLIVRNPGKPIVMTTKPKPKIKLIVRKKEPPKEEKKGYTTTSDSYRKFINYGYYEKGSIAEKLTDYARSKAPTAREINRIENPLIRNDVIGRLAGMYGNLKQFPNRVSLTQTEANELMKKKLK